MNRNRPLYVILGAFVLGFVIGLFVFGWGLTPVTYTGAGPQDLLPQYREAYIRNLADLYSFDGNQERVRASLSVWADAPSFACQMSAASGDPADSARLQALATVLNGTGCVGVSITPIAPGSGETEGGGTTSFLLICALGLILAILLGAIALLWQRQQPSTPKGSGSGFGQKGQPLTDAPVMAPVGGEEVQATPVARFRTTYTRGHDSYDDSFSIENTNGDFLGECGAGVSETIGVDSPKRVTALEVWLFDKNDIRTVTKVLMSDYAFFKDEAIKAKLAPKGEPVLVRQGETAVLETASLIINATISEVIYGTDEGLPEKSYFERLVVELSAWSKEGNFNPDIEGRVDELMNY